MFVIANALLMKDLFSTWLIFLTILGKENPSKFNCCAIPTAAAHNLPHGTQQGCFPTELHQCTCTGWLWGERAESRDFNSRLLAKTTKNQLEFEKKEKKKTPNYGHHKNFWVFCYLKISLSLHKKKKKKWQRPFYKHFIGKVFGGFVSTLA